MIDTRKRYKMEQGYCRSDFSFYQKYPETIDAIPVFHALQDANDEWVVTDQYMHKGKWASEMVFVLNNLKGVQIEASLFGFKRVYTQHDKDVVQRAEYEEFYHALAALKPPASLKRWHSDVLGMFDNDFEDILYYGEENV